MNPSTPLPLLINALTQSFWSAMEESLQGVVQLMQSSVAQQQNILASLDLQNKLLADLLEKA